MWLCSGWACAWFVRGRAWGQSKRQRRVEEKPNGLALRWVALSAEEAVGSRILKSKRVARMTPCPEHDAHTTCVWCVVCVWLWVRERTRRIKR